jgi:hypothetical protein
MRTLARLVVNLAFLAGTGAVLTELPNVKAYQHASHNARIAVPVIIAAVMFVLAWVVLSKVIPAKKKAPQRPSYPYANPAGRR